MVDCWICYGLEDVWLICGCGIVVCEWWMCDWWMCDWAMCDWWTCDWLICDSWMFWCMGRPKWLHGQTKLHAWGVQSGCIACPNCMHGIGGCVIGGCVIGGCVIGDV